MSLAEIKDEIVALPSEERLELAALIAHLNRKDDPDYQTELDHRMQQMDAGHKVTQAELERRHKEPSRSGR